MVCRGSHTVRGAQGQSYSAGSHPGCEKSLVFTGDSKWERHIGSGAPMGYGGKTVRDCFSSLRNSELCWQEPSVLRADTCRAGLRPPETGSSLTSTLEFTWSWETEDTHSPELRGKLLR
ncbi:UNVERIFIED_CONTAM: hypothetical protein FKN15_035470 [Acipenser sinensis]